MKDLIRALARRGIKNLATISNNDGVDRLGSMEELVLEKKFDLRLNPDSNQHSGRQ